MQRNISLNQFNYYQEDEAMRTDTFDSRMGRAIDPDEIDAAIKRARRLHAEEFNRLLRKAVAGVASLARGLRRRREYRLAHEALLRMDDRELRDIGICRGEITRAVYGPKGRQGVWTRLNAARDPIAALDEIRPGRSEPEAAPRGTLPAPRPAANDDCPRDVA